MEHNFTVEEINLICIFAGEGRNEVIEDISKAAKHLKNNEMLELLGKVCERLKNMTDEEFSGFDFVAAE